MNTGTRACIRNGCGKPFTLPVPLSGPYVSEYRRAFAERYCPEHATQDTKPVVVVEVRWKVTLDKHRATWHYFTTNPQGGGFGSNNCGPKYVALHRATQYIPKGEQYMLVVNGKQSIEVKA